MALFDTLQEKRKERKKLAEQTNEMLVTITKENRAWTAAENEQWDKRHADIDRLAGEIEKLEKQIQLDKLLDSPAPDTRTAGMNDVDHRQTIDPGRQKAEKPDQWKALRKYALYGVQGLSPLEVRHFMWPQGEAGAAERHTIEESFGGNYEQRALGGSSSAGDALIPQGFFYNLNVALKWYSGIIDPDVCTYEETTMGNDMPYPNVDDTGNSGEITSENSTVTLTTSGTTPAQPTFSAVTFHAYMYDSGTVLIPIQLLQDSAFDLQDRLVGSTDIASPRAQRGLLSVRIGRKLNKDCTTGTGSNQPNGIVTAASLGFQMSSPTAITYNDLVELEHSVDPAYRGSDAYGLPIAKFMFNDSTLKAVKKLVDGNSRPLWIAGGVSEGVQNRRPDVLNGYAYVINQDMASLGSSAKPVLFGDFKKYIIRRVRGLDVFTFKERYMDSLQVGFLAYQRFDGNLLTAGTPVKYLANSAT